MLSYSIYHHVRLDTRFVTLFLSVIILEGVGRQLDDHMSMVEQVLPIIRAALPEYEDVLDFFRGSLSRLFDWLFIRVLPFVKRCFQL